MYYFCLYIASWLLEKLQMGAIKQNINLKKNYILKMTIRNIKLSLINIKIKKN
jgi:hypothetical protein